MSETEHAIQKSVEDREEWFLGQLEQSPIPVEELKSHLLELRKHKKAEQAESLAQLLEEALAEKQDFLHAIQVLKLRASWHRSVPSYKETCRTAALSLLKGDRDVKALVQHAAFDRPNGAVECLRRLELLLRLKKGVLCYEKTWGFGVVQKVDGFYKRVEIDFDKKHDHHMSLAYAAESLDLIEDDHILAIKHNEPEKLQELIANDPAEVVRIVLKSYGPVPAARLQELVVPHVVPDASWKKFWEAARKGLKKDPLVHLPSKRSEPIELLHEEKSFDHAWFDKLANERNMETILVDLDHLCAQVSGDEIEEDFKHIVGNRLAFVVKGAGRRKINLTARAIILASRIGVPSDLIDVEQHVMDLLHPKRLVEVAGQLSARDFKLLLSYLLEHHEQETIAVLLKVLLKLPVSPLAEVLDNLCARGHEEVCSESLRSAIAMDKATVAIACWISRNLQRIDEWRLGSWSQVVQMMIREMDADYAFEEGRAQKQLGDRFKNPEWLKSILDRLDEKERRAAIQGVKESSGWLLLDQRSILGQMVKICPELERELVVEAKTQEEIAAQRDRVTSLRSYEERKKQMAKIISVELPRIAKEIGKAREYGDLRENFEFKAAKDQQRLLVQRRDELEQMLHDVTPTDFSRFTNDQVGVGTSVVLKYEDGKEETFYVLGEWDTEEEMGIISSQTRMAGALMGKRKGDVARVPTETGEQDCVLTLVAGLPEHIRMWINGEDHEE